MSPAQLTDMLRTFITLLLVPGGPIVAWITLHHKQRSDDIPKQTVTEAELTHVLDDTGIAARWQAYADGIEARLNRRIDEQNQQIAEAEARNSRLSGLLDVYGVYTRTLRVWIQDGKPPPPPDYPAAIDPACTGWDAGDHVTSHHPDTSTQEES